MSYGPDTADIFRRAGSYVDRILRARRPQTYRHNRQSSLNLPLNPIAAKVIGLTVPENFLLLADEVIE